MMSALPSLEVLSIDCGSALVGTCGITFTEMGEALRAHGALLKTLILNMEESLFLLDHDGVLAPMGPLRALTSLRLLSIPAVTLLGEEQDDDDSEGDRFEVPRFTEVLPFSLRTLNLVGGRAVDVDYEDFDEQLWGLMSDARFSELKTIKVNQRESFSRDAKQVGWDASESNKSWVVLKRV